MLLAVRLSSYGYTWEVSRAFKKLELLTLKLLSRSPNFPLTSITRYTAVSLTWLASIQIYWNTNMAAVSTFWDNNMAAMTSCESALYAR